jgi:hypothetical protein
MRRRRKHVRNNRRTRQHQRSLGFSQCALNLTEDLDEHFQHDVALRSGLFNPEERLASHPAGHGATINTVATLFNPTSAKSEAV